MPAGFSFGPLQLPLSPMGVFAILIELPNDVTVQRSHDADGRHHLVCKFVQKQNRRAEYDAGGFAMVGPDGDNFRYNHAIVFARRHNETRLLS
jgi:hypothetical protein